MNMNSPVSSGIWDGLGAGVLNGVGGIVGTLVGAHETEKTNDLNAALARENMALQKEANEANIASAERMNSANLANQNVINQNNIDYQKEYNQQIFNREDNAISRQVADLQKNGLNSLLAGNGLGSGGTSASPIANASATIGMAEQQAIKNEMHYEKANAGLQIAQTITGMVNSIQQTRAQNLQEMSIKETNRHNLITEEETRKQNEWNRKNGTFFGQIMNNIDGFNALLDTLGLRDTFDNAVKATKDFFTPKYESSSKNNKNENDNSINWTKIYNGEEMPPKELIEKNKYSVGYKLGKWEVKKDKNGEKFWSRIF